MRAVDSRKRVSFGGSLWNTTLEIDDLPLLNEQSASQPCLDHTAERGTRTYLLCPISINRGFPCGGGAVMVSPCLPAFFLVGSTDPLRSWSKISSRFNFAELA